MKTAMSKFNEVYAKLIAEANRSSSKRKVVSEGNGVVVDYGRDVYLDLEMAAEKNILGDIGEKVLAFCNSMNPENAKTTFKLLLKVSQDASFSDRGPDQRYLPVFGKEVDRDSADYMDLPDEVEVTDFEVFKISDLGASQPDYEKYLKPISNEELNEAGIVLTADMCENFLTLASKDDSLVFDVTDWEEC